MHERSTKAMQTSTITLLFGLTMLLLGCGIFGDGQKTEKSEAGAVSTVVVGVRAPAYYGPTSLEERILASPVIARVRLDSVSSTAESGRTYQGLKHIALLEFGFRVLEYLKGNGANDIVAVWAAESFDTQQEAEDALPAIAAERAALWDNRDAIVFLQRSATYLPSTQQADRFFFSGVHLVGGVSDDYYSLGSRGNKLWLPTEAASDAQSQPGGDQQRFLMDVAPAAGMAPTITLGELKTRIASVTAKLDAGDGSEQYTECLERMYSYEGQDQYTASIGDESLFTGIPDGKLTSGLGASSVVHEAIAYTDASNIRLEVWLEGTDADLFSVEFGETVPSDFSGADGNRVLFEFAYRVVSARPLPAGIYTTDYNLRDAHFVPCEGYTYRHDWTIPVEAPEGTLHEAFFDPVTDGAAVAADSANGVLKPTTFTDANGASSTIERIEWDAGTDGSGTVKLKLTPHDGIAGHILDFIPLDGSVSLSLKVDDATPDAANDTFSWSVASQPWEDSDELMLRIREVPDCSNGTVIPNPADNPGLMRDCITLLGLKDALRGAATLNWSVDTPISDWDGVRVLGSPSRVTRLQLTSEGLTGTIPPDLARLDGLEFLWLNYNQLTGEIPAALGNLASLESLVLNDNQLSGEVPEELGDLASLEALWLNKNRLSGEIPSELADLINLRGLLLSDNRLSGEVPAELGDLASLETLWLGGNQLTGEIPSELGGLTNLQDLSLPRNGLTGEVPAELGNLANLNRLRLARNQLTGCIPPALQDVEDNDLNSLGLQNCATP